MYKYNNRVTCNVPCALTNHGDHDICLSCVDLAQQPARPIILGHDIHAICLACVNCQANATESEKTTSE